MIDQSKPPLEELAHSGVKGMKWGVRKERPSAIQVRAAQRRHDGAKTKLRQAEKKAARISDPKARDKALKAVGKQKLAYLKNPDRVTANRLTAGQAAFIMALSIPTTGGAFGVGLIGGQNVARARIAYKQEHGIYDKRAKKGQRLGI